MLPGSAENQGRLVLATSAAMPRNFAPSSKLTFDPSLTRLIAAASAKSVSRYEEPASWPDVFTPGNSPGGSTAPAPTGGSGGGQVTPSLPTAPTAPVTPAAGGGGVWVPPPVILPPSGSDGGSGTPVSPPSVVPEFPAPVVTPTIPEPLPIPDTAVVISTPAAPVPVDGRVPDGGATVLMLGISSLLFAALRKRLSSV